MDISFTPEAWDDYLYWHSTDKDNFKKINELIKEIQRTPFAGKGKPEPLKYDLKGFWSRRINQEHRLVYRIADTAIEIISVRFHYKK